MAPTPRSFRVAVPVVLATYARRAKSFTDEQPMYDWVVVLKAAEDPLRDLTSVIASVEFTLHPSFPEAKRVAKAAPFLVQEQGWGEFDIAVKINFKRSDMYKAVHTSHLLRLYALNAEAVVANERLDTLCFSGDVQVPEVWPRLHLPSEDNGDWLMQAVSASYGGLAETLALERAVGEELQREVDTVRSSVVSLEEELRRLEEIYLTAVLQSIAAHSG